MNTSPPTALDFDRHSADSVVSKPGRRGLWRTIMQLFNTENTTDYTPNELAALNAEWDRFADRHSLEEFTDEYDEAAGDFCDRVSRRR